MQEGEPRDDLLDRYPDISASLSLPTTWDMKVRLAPFYDMFAVYLFYESGPFADLLQSAEVPGRDPS